MAHNITDQLHISIDFLKDFYKKMFVFVVFLHFRSIHKSYKYNRRRIVGKIEYLL